MSLLSFGSLYQLADQLASPLPVVAAGGADRTVLEALSIAQRRGWVKPILTGSVAEIESLAHDLDIELSEFQLIDSDQPAVAAVAEVKAGRASLLMKGQIATPDLMKAVLSRENGLRTERCICQVVLMEIARDSRRFLLSDTGITIQPTLEQKADILRSMVDVATALSDGASSELPRIGVMSATEKVTESMPDTLDAAELARRNQAGELPGCIVQGPLSFDLAYATDAAEKKRISGSVVGAADGMLFPNLLSANLTVKALMYTADCKFGGVLCGAACPVVFMSRADSTETRLNSLAFTLRMLTAKDEFVRSGGPQDEGL
ncbi:phosphate acyltransferase [Schlesneria sp. T3-172]|uniref:phosphate acyltransferase n=1 Tax=Schlesneria TaxID=656899 RepID=UPI002EFF1B4A